MRASSVPSAPRPLETADTASSALKPLLEMGVLQPKDAEKKMLAEQLDKKASATKLLDEGLISKEQYEALTHAAQHPAAPLPDRTELLQARSQWERLVEEAMVRSYTGELQSEQDLANIIEEARKRIDQINRQLGQPRKASPGPSEKGETPIETPSVGAHRPRLTCLSVRSGLVPTEILHFDARGSDTVRSLKGQVCQSLGMDPSLSFLTFQGYQLSDDMKLDDVPVPDGAELLIGQTGVVGCVVEGTKVALWDNSQKNVEDLRIGDTVVSHQPDMTSVASGVIIENKTSKASLILDVNEGLLRATPEQPILIKTRGWVPLRDLKVGEDIFNGLTKTWIEVRSIDAVRGIFSVYNPKARPIDNYLANGILLDFKPAPELESRWSLEEKMHSLRLERDKVSKLRALMHALSRGRVSPSVGQRLAAEFDGKLEDINSQLSKVEHALSKSLPEHLRALTAEAGFPFQMCTGTTYSILLRLIGAKGEASIVLEHGGYIERKGFDVAVLPGLKKKRVTIEAEGNAFAVSPRRTVLEIPEAAQKIESHFTVTPKLGFAGMHKLLFHFYQGPVRLSTLNADIELVPDRAAAVALADKGRLLDIPLRVIRETPSKGTRTLGEVISLEGVDKRLMISDIRRGGNAIVYICKDPLASNSFTALKTPKDDLLFSDGSPIEFEEFEARCRRFEREAVSWISLGQHPNIVQAFVYGRLDGKPYILLEYVDGPNLAEIIKTQKVTSSQWLRLAAQICEGMKHAHAKKVLHRDLKPANILLDRNMVAKITDFGLARFIGDLSLTISRDISGSLPYMAPESFLHPEEVDERADIYSFGVTTYEMSCGTRPFAVASLPEAISSHLSLAPAPPSSINRSLPTELDDLVLKCLSKERENRFRSFAEVASALENLSFRWQ
jgi:hypothetical protein